ncbi:Z354C protein, partial [Anthoscopus minutus]|nr:Z354C protein [Anthoscopus minutus]
SREIKSPWENLVEEAVLSSSTAQESNGEEKPQRSCTRRGCRCRSWGSEEETPTVGWGCSQSLELGVHEQLHNGEKLHRCSKCQKSFSWRSHMINHMAIHTGDWRYECEKSIRTSCELIVQLRSYTGEWPYKCPECGKSFVSCSSSITCGRI